jgi:hydroxyethylthiazole kinase
VSTSRSWPHPELAQDLAELRRQAPLVHCLTNIVASQWTANVLLAAGASPAMVIASEEASIFAGIASALLINVGTITAEEARVQLAAAASARAAGRPWVLDPVAVGALAFRTRIATELLDHRPAVIRGNASEILALSGTGAGGKGVDSTAGSLEALPGARALSERTGAVVAVSGAVDFVTDGREVVEVPGGNVIATRVTGTGCALGAVIAAFLSVSPSPLRAAVAASALFKVAAERAGRDARGPGSFAAAFLDQLSRVGIDSDG